MTSRRKFLEATATAGVGALLPWRANAQASAATAAPAAPAAPIAAGTINSPPIPMFVDQLPVPMPAIAPTNAAATATVDGVANTPAPLYVIRATENPSHIISSGFKTVKGVQIATPVWGYTNGAGAGSFPGPTIEVQPNQPIQVQWVNDIQSPTHLLAPSIDPAFLLPAVYPNGLPQVRLVTHVHGGHQSPNVDGTPFQWYTRTRTEVNGTGPSFPGTDTFVYSNKQRAATLWYHDHALGTTRLSVYAGLAGFYIVRDPNEASLGLPKCVQDAAGTWWNYEVPIAIQDRTFNSNGTLYYPPPPTPPEVFGDTMVINGKSWPRLTVEPRRYRFRLLNGCTARFLRMTLIECDATGNPIGNNKKVVPGPAIYQIGTEGGFLAAPVALNTVNAATGQLTPLIMGNGERCDVIVDFSTVLPVAPATKRYFLLTNDAATPFSNTLSTKGAVPQVMMFEVGNAVLGPADGSLPVNQLALPAPERLNKAAATVTRNVVLKEIFVGKNGKMMVVTLNSLGYVTDPMTMALYPGENLASPTPTEGPVIGSTEVWNIINLTPDTHPIHLHHSMFQLVGRQAINAVAYTTDYLLLPPGTPSKNPDPFAAKYAVAGATFQAAATAFPNEDGWKDTIRANPNEVTQIVVRFDGAVPNVNDPVADANYQGDYVWHCHILEHEENDMMRPLKVLPAGSTPVIV